MLDFAEEEESLNIKEIYERIKYYLKSVGKMWWLIMLLGILGLVNTALYAYFSSSYYEADLTFVVKSKDGSGSNLDNILGQLGWGASSGGANLPKVKSVSFSKSVLKEALYDSATVLGKKDLIANHIVNVYEMGKKWETSGALDTFSRFLSAEKYNDSSRLQNQAFGSVLNLVRSNKDNSGLLAIKLDQETDMISFKVRTLNEELSYALSNSVFYNLKEFYLQDEESSATNTLDQLKRETDSVGNLLRSKEYQLANAQDRNYGIILRKNQVNQDAIRREIIVLSNIYGEMRKNLELRSFSLKTNTSIFDVLEHPVLPLPKKDKSVPVYAIIGLLIGIFIGILFVIVRRFLLDELK